MPRQTAASRAGFGAGAIGPAGAGLPATPFAGERGMPAAKRPSTDPKTQARQVCNALGAPIPRPSVH